MKSTMNGCKLFIFFLGAHASWVFKEHAICASSSALTFTGFKISRTYAVETLSPTSMHYLQLHHCNHGKVDYTKSWRIQKADDIDWNTPICVIKPDLGTKLNDLPSDKIHLLDEATAQEKVKGSSPVKTFLVNSIDKLIKMLAKGRVKYMGKKESDHIDDIRKSSIHSSLEWESRNMVCYKLARRRKYAKRSFLYYMPQTFVGGLFECMISSETKKTIFQNLTSQDFTSGPVNFKCDASLAIPIRPLVADDTTRQTFERKGSKLVHTIPYLKTASPLDLRFRTSDTNDMFDHSWARDIEVNENYYYNEIEINLAAQAVAATTDFLTKMVSLKPNFKLSSYLSLRPHESEAETGTDISFESLPFDQKIGMLVANRTARRTSFAMLQNLQSLWDGVIKT